MIACGIRQNEHARLKVGIPKALPLYMRAKIREVSGVETDADHRGKGYARSLLARVCISADLDDTWLLVHVEPGDDTTDKARLLKLYLSLGFVPFQADPLLMIRQSAHARAAA